jgi:hypothetical protein
MIQVSSKLDARADVVAPLLLEGLYGHDSIISEPRLQEWSRRGHAMMPPC